MASSFSDTDFDFDLNFLRPSPDTTVIPSRLEKQRRAIKITKKKITATDSLINKYGARNSLLIQTEKNLHASKEECKQICLDYRKSLEACTKLENDIQILQISNKEIQAKCFHAENQYEAVKSHANQLQILVKENETQIEALTIENKLSKSNAKDCEKKSSLLQKRNDELIKDICLVRDILLGKRKLNKKHKKLLQKYDKYKSSDIDDSISNNGHSDNENDHYEDAPRSPFCEEKCDITEKSHDKALKPDTAPESTQFTNAIKVKIPQNVISKRDDSDNDLVSVDTGRGSSLAFSDNDKCFHSPDYFINDSPISEASLNVNKQKRMLVDIATSPIHVYETVQIATSPIVFEDNTLTHSDSIEIENKDVCASPNHFGPTANSIPVAMVERALSPIQLNQNKEVSTSPIRIDSRSIATSPINICDRTDNFPHINKSHCEKECLELNNSNNLTDNNGNDGEIEMILNKMRLHQQLITPIPATPAKLRCVDPVLVNSVSSKLAEHPKTGVCQDAAMIREDNKKLHASIAELAKEIINIRSILMNQVSAKVQKSQDSNMNRKSSIEDNDLIIIDPNQNNVYKHTNAQRRESNNLKNNLVFSDKSIQSKNQETSYTSQNQQADLIISPIVNDDLDGTADKSSTNEDISALDRLQFEDYTRCSTESDTEIGELSNKKNANGEEAAKNKCRLGKIRKLTKLGRLKKILLPKCKIRKAQLPPLKRLHVKPKQILLPKKKKVTEADSSATLNDKTVYENALKVMKTMKSKQDCRVIIEPLVTSKTNVYDSTLRNETQKDRVPEKDKHYTKLKYIETNTVCDSKTNVSQNISISTRTHIKSTIDSNTTQTDSAKQSNHVELNSEFTKNKFDTNHDALILTEEIPSSRKRMRHLSTDRSEVACKRILRSCPVPITDNNNIHVQNTDRDNTIIDIENQEETIRTVTKNTPIPPLCSPTYKSRDSNTKSINSCYDNSKNIDLENPEKHVVRNNQHVAKDPKESILCVMIEKYGVESMNYSVKKISDSITNIISKKIEDHITTIIQLPANEVKVSMNYLVQDLQNCDIKAFVSGLMKYLKDPARKIELFSKVCSPPAPPLTKPEQVLLYVVSQLKICWPASDIVNKILGEIEYTLFALNRAPHFDVIESMSHFYAALCRYYNFKSRLRLFMMDAMYCLQFKCVPLIKQCIDVWMHILPLAHMGIAKSPLVTCLVYLLHFYKCEDRFNRVQDIRNTLHRKYFYQITEWNESKILEMFSNSVKELRGIPIESKMLRMALIIIAKRQGPRWCQNNIIKNLLLPMIENKDVSEKVKEFCVSMLGPLLKPYPLDMKVHCEIIMNQLINMLEQKPSRNMGEAIVISLIFMSKHNQNRVLKALISWKTQEPSPELEKIFRDFIKSKPVKAWILNLSRIAQFK